MGRPTKLTPEVQGEILKVLATGGTIEDACANVGLGETTFYRWQQKGQRAKTGLYREFWEALTRAQANARIVAIVALRKGMTESETVTNTTETVTETKLRKTKTPDGIVEQPYEYTKTVQRRSVTTHPPDWRAGVEYLKRRDAANWSDKIAITVQDLRQQAIEDIKAGRITYEALASEDISLADELFATAGISVTQHVREGAAE